MGKNHRFPVKSTGFSLMETLLAMAIISIVLLAVTALDMKSREQATKMIDATQVDIFRRQLVGLIRNDMSWQQTIVHNNSSAMNCLQTPGGTCTVVGFAAAQPFVLYDGAGNLVYDPTSGNGFTATGVSCVGFSSVASTPNCPFSYDMRWYATSANPSPVVAVYATLLVTPNSNIILNPGRYSIGNLSGGVMSNPILRSAQ